MESKNLIFKILGDHQDVLNPYDEIRELNKSVIIEEKNKIDYQAIHLETEIGFAEIWGYRDKQEDRVVVGEVSEFAELNEEERLYVLNKTIDTLQKTLTEKHLGKDQGSTLCAVIVVDRTIYTVNIGDSMAFLIRISSKGKPTIKRLNEELHHPTTPKENERLKVAGKKVIAGRLNGSLALSRAMGDEDYIEAGLIHDPDIYAYDLIPNKDELFFIIVACDGLTESETMTEAMIAETVAQHKVSPADDIAKVLAEKAKELGSEDNISVIVLPFAVEKKLIPFAAVFDGHGGDEVSDELASIFEGTLKFVLNFMLLMR